MHFAPPRVRQSGDGFERRFGQNVCLCVLAPDTKEMCYLSTGEWERSIWWVSGLWDRLRTVVSWLDVVWQRSILLFSSALCLEDALRRLEVEAAGADPVVFLPWFLFGWKYMFRFFFAVTNKESGTQAKELSSSSLPVSCGMFFLYSSGMGWAWGTVSCSTTGKKYRETRLLGKRGLSRGGGRRKDNHVYSHLHAFHRRLFLSFRLVSVFWFLSQKMKN